jgi:hypothetical protein
MTRSGKKNDLRLVFRLGVRFGCGSTATERDRQKDPKQESDYKHFE